MLSDYVDRHFYDHICAATTAFFAKNISNNHPAVEFLHDLETTAYYVDENSSGYILARRMIQSILSWANGLYRHLTWKVGAPYVLWFHFSDTTP